jgi:hypothetical protein
VADEGKAASAVSRASFSRLPSPNPETHSRLAAHIPKLPGSPAQASYWKTNTHRFRALPPRTRAIRHADSTNQDSMARAPPGLRTSLGLLLLVRRSSCSLGASRSRSCGLGGSRSSSCRLGGSRSSSCSRRGRGPCRRPGRSSSPRGSTPPCPTRLASLHAHSTATGEPVATVIHSTAMSLWQL